MTKKIEKILDNENHDVTKLEMPFYLSVYTGDQSTGKMQRTLAGSEIQPVLLAAQEDPDGETQRSFQVIRQRGNLILIIQEDWRHEYGPQWNMKWWAMELPIIDEKDIIRSEFIANRPKEYTYTCLRKEIGVLFEIKMDDGTLEYPFFKLSDMPISVYVDLIESLNRATFLLHQKIWPRT